MAIFLLLFLMIPDIYVNFQPCTSTVFLVVKFTGYDCPSTHLSSSAPFANRAFALLAAIEPFPGKIFHAPSHVALSVASSPSKRTNGKIILLEVVIINFHRESCTIFL